MSWEVESVGGKDTWQSLEFALDAVRERLVASNKEVTIRPYQRDTFTLWHSGSVQSGPLGVAVLEQKEYLTQQERDQAALRWLQSGHLVKYDQ